MRTTGRATTLATGSGPQLRLSVDRASQSPRTKRLSGGMVRAETPSAPAAAASAAGDCRGSSAHASGGRGRSAPLTRRPPEGVSSTTSPPTAAMRLTKRSRSPSRPPAWARNDEQGHRWPPRHRQERRGLAASSAGKPAWGCEGPRRARAGVGAPAPPWLAGWAAARRGRGRPPRTAAGAARSPSPRAPRRPRRGCGRTRGGAGAGRASDRKRTPGCGRG